MPQLGQRASFCARNSLELGGGAPPPRFNGPGIGPIVQQNILRGGHLAEIGSLVGYAGAPGALHPAIINELPHEGLIRHGFSDGHSQWLMPALFHLFRIMRIIGNETICCGNIRVMPWVGKRRAGQAGSPEPQLFIGRQRPPFQQGRESCAQAVMRGKVPPQQGVEGFELWMQQRFAADDANLARPVAQAAQGGAECLHRHVRALIRTQVAIVSGAIQA